MSPSLPAGLDAMLTARFGGVRQTVAVGSRPGTFVVVTGERRLIAKRLGPELSAGEVERLHDALERAGILAPPLLEVIRAGADTFALYRFLEGVTPRAEDPDWPLLWDRAFALLARLREIPAPIERAPHALWLARVAATAAEDPIAAELHAELRAAPPPAGESLAHGDFAPQNFLAVPGGLALLDWEEAGRAPPGFDAGWLLAQNRLGAGPRLPDATLRGRLLGDGAESAALRHFEGVGLLRMHHRAVGWARERPAAAPLLARVRVAIGEFLRAAPRSTAREARPLSMAGTLRAVEARLPAALVSRAARDRLHALSSLLPAALTRWLYLETRLAARSGRVDLIVAIERAGRELLAGRNPAIALPAELCRHPLWERLAALCRDWSDPASPLHAGIDTLWLEFDLASGRGSLPQPGVFVGFAGAETDGAGLLALTEHALRPLTPRALAASRASLRRCIERLPHGATLPYLGALLPRGEETLRLCITGLPDRDLLRYLGSVGWPGDAGELAGRLAGIAAARRGAALPDAALVHLDVGRSVQPRVGLEYVFSRPEQVRGRVMETAFLEELVRLGVCAPAKRDALLRWPGCSREPLPHELWPSLLDRRVNHVKLVHQPGGALEAKAYLSLSHAYHPPAHRAPPLSDREPIRFPGPGPHAVFG